MLAGSAANKLSDRDRMLLERWARRRSTPARLALRSRIVIWAASELRTRKIARELRCDSKTVSRWRRRFEQGGVAGMEKDALRGGARTKKSNVLIQQIMGAARQQPSAAAF